MYYFPNKQKTPAQFAKDLDRSKPVISDKNIKASYGH